MAGRKLVNATYNVDTDWKDETESKNVLKKGWFNINFDGDNVLAGSSVEVNGIMYIFDSDETPSGTLSNGEWYLTVRDSSGTAVLEYTQTYNGSYDFSKNGYYDSTGLKRYLISFVSKGSNKIRIQLLNKYIESFPNNTLTFNINDDDFFNQPVKYGDIYIIENAKAGTVFAPNNDGEIDSLNIIFDNRSPSPNADDEDFRYYNVSIDTALMSPQTNDIILKFTNGELSSVEIYFGAAYKAISLLDFNTYIKPKFLNQEVYTSTPTNPKDYQISHNLAEAKVYLNGSWHTITS